MASPTDDELDPIARAWLVEVERRRRQSKDDPNAFVDWDIAKQQIQQRLRSLRERR